MVLKEAGEGNLRGRRRTGRCAVGEAKEGQDFKKGVASPANALERLDKITNKHSLTLGKLHWNEVSVQSGMWPGV